MDAQRKQDSVIGQMKRLININIPIWLVSVFGAILTSISWFLSTLIMATIQKGTIDIIIQNGNVFKFTAIIIISVISLRIPTILGYAINSWASEKLSAYLQIKIVKHWLFRDISEETKYSSGDIMTRLVNDCSDKLSTFYFQGVGLKVVEPIVTGTLALILIYKIDFRFLLVSMIIGVLATSISLVFAKRIEELQKKSQEYNSNVTEVFSESIRNILNIKTMNIKSERINVFNNFSKEASTLAYKVELFDVLSKNISFFMELINVLIAFSLGFFIKDFNFTNIIIVTQMQVFVNSMLSNLGTMWNYLVKTSVSSKRVFEIIDKVNPVMTDIHQKENTLEEKYKIELESISFSYDNRKILDKVSISAETGEVIVILGETGTGKSTLLDIIAGFNTKYAGTIKINGNNLSELSYSQKSSLIKLFEQKPSLFNVSIRDNIQIAGDLPLEDSILSEYAEKVGIKSIEKLPSGYNTQVGELGTKFSGGEKQRISLMRIFATKSPIILLDEPTSSLDILSEELVCRSLKQLKKNKILIIVSHRMKLLEIADKIYVLKDGKFEERKVTDANEHLDFFASS